MDVVLVHGAFHGAWCWDLLAPELERLGHRIVTVDLPIWDPALGTSDYADVVVKASASAGLDKPVVVGHSMGGLVIPLVAARRPVRRLVFLAGLLPDPGRSLAEQRAVEPIDGQVPIGASEWTDLGDDVWMIGPKTATELFFHDAPPRTAAWAVDRLRPQAYRYMHEPTPLAKWPKTPRSYIVCRADRAVNPVWARVAARERLGVEPLEIDGSHSPFLSRPAELAKLLAGLFD